MGQDNKSHIREVVMDRLFVIVAFVALVSTAVAVDGTSENVRLLKVESILETVLHQNEALQEKIAKLEERVTHLEEENSKLHRELSESKEVPNLKERPEETDKELQVVRNGDVKLGIQQHGSARNQISRTGTKHRQSPKRFLADFQGATVAFTAVVTPADLTNVGAGQAIVYDQAITNVGGAYSNHSGIFTAPVKGTYAFNFAVMIAPGLNEYLELVKDGVHVMWNYGHASGSAHIVSASRTATLQLDQGNEVWVRTQPSSSHGTGTIHGNGFTTFSGWLIAMEE